MQNRIDAIPLVVKNTKLIWLNLTTFLLLSFDKLLEKKIVAPIQ